jgi:hypothetical protein
MRSGLFLAAVGLTSACSMLGDTGDDGGGKADGFGDDSCNLPEYGDGICQSDLACAAPDIDCFVFFDSEAAAATWFSGIEETMAAQEFRPPRPTVAQSDPRFQRMREILERGWQAYKKTNPLADLAAHEPLLVVLEDPTVNAFVMPDLESGKAGFAVMVQTGTLDAEGLDEAAMQGLVMHELTHAVRLHVVPEVRERIRRFYLADDGEPLGFEQVDDPVARQHGDAWRGFASEVGPFASAELGGVPLGGQLSQIFGTVISPRKEDPACVEPLAALRSLADDLTAHISPLDAGLHLEEPMRDHIDAALAAIRDQCLADFPDGFIEVVAGIAGVTPEQIRASLTPEDLAMVDGVHFIDAIAALAIDRRSKMRATEEAFATASGYGWDRLRFYSTEEAADDATVPVLHEIPLDPNGLGSFFLRALLDPETSAACSAIIARGDTPPYGADLSDEHHATCWRVDHVRALAASGVLYPPEDDPSQYLRLAATGQSARRPRLIPPRVSDVVVY